jgi:hypothetical protein
MMTLLVLRKYNVIEVGYMMIRQRDRSILQMTIMGGNGCKVRQFLAKIRLFTGHQDPP